MALAIHGPLAGGSRWRRRSVDEFESAAGHAIAIHARSSEAVGAARRTNERTTAVGLVAGFRDLGREHVVRLVDHEHERPAATARLAASRLGVGHRTEAAVGQEHIRQRDRFRPERLARARPELFRLDVGAEQRRGDQGHDQQEVELGHRPQTLRSERRKSHAVAA